ncbi:MAG TPA: MarR family winged helix-turn-helix transcriptional regulator [Verrucomicrobiae bacterium]|nr:MarR family winged helix-turn-helix transcriptional regulator [Verrucomicrobiae bacterium]
MDDPNTTSKKFEDALANLQYILIARRVQASDEPMRLTWRHFDLMAFVKAEGSAVPSVISEKLGMSRSSTSKYLKSLEEKGLLEKTASGTDRRSHSVILTAQANDILENIYAGQRENARLAMTALSPKDAKLFAVLAAKITAALDDDSLRTV